MARKITNEDLANRGVMGLPDVPGLTAIEMQKKLEEIPREVIIPRYNELVDSVADICDEFSKLNSYAVGDYCIYQNKLYKCNTATNGDWDASKWTETSVGDELKSVNSNLEKINNFQFVIETAITESGSNNYDYPNGYTKDNSIIESIIVRNNQNGLLYVNPTGVVCTIDSRIKLYTTESYYIGSDCKISLRRFK